MGGGQGVVGVIVQGVFSLRCFASQSEALLPGSPFSVVLYRLCPRLVGFERVMVSLYLSNVGSCSRAGPIVALKARRKSFLLELLGETPDGGRCAVRLTCECRYGHS